MKRPKISLITPLLVDYKMPLFELLNQNYDITYLITRTLKSHTSSIKGTEKLKYKNFKHHRLWKGSVSFSAIKHLLVTHYDIVISHDPHTLESVFGCYIAKLKREKFIIYSETWDWPRHPSTKLLNPFLWLMFKLTDALITTSKKAAEYSQKLGYSPNKKYFKVYLPTFDYFNKINKAELYKKIPETKNKKILLYLNRIVPYKGLDYLIKALPKLNKENIHLIICGESYPYKMDFFKEIKHLIKELQLQNTSFVGYSEEKKRFYLAIADLVVSPATIRDFDGEAWGATIIEAMSAQKPVIVTNAVGCAEEIVENGRNGLIIPYGNVEEIANAIKKIISNEELIKEMGENSRRIWQTITWGKYFNGYKEAIEYCLNQSL